MIGDVTKSGGLATNIGIHLFDMVMWLFGKCQNLSVLKNESNNVSGILSLERAHVTFELSTDKKFLPKGHKSFRSIEIDGKQVTLDNSFNDLHTAIYQDILDGGGFGIEDARPSIELTHQIRGS
jgi:UDP-N-acetyl-2-amino-2-deoxyglucuronate dehydrogenase